MSSRPPRADSSKKRNQLEKFEQELRHALRHDFSPDKIKAAVEKLRAAQIGLLKADRHWEQEPRLGHLLNNAKINRLTEQIENWKNKSVEQIIQDYDERG